MVAVARILNATLVIPELDKKSFWRDSRLDVQFFICSCGLPHLLQPISLLIIIDSNEYKASSANSVFHLVHLYSTFADIFDELHFIKSLEGDVRIIKELPKESAFLPRARKHFSSWASLSYYEEMSQLWKDYRVLVYFLLFDVGSFREKNMSI